MFISWSLYSQYPLSKNLDRLEKRRSCVPAGNYNYISLVDQPVA